MEWHTVSRLSPHMELTDEGYLVVRDVPIARTGTQIYFEHEVPPLQGDAGGRVHVARDASEVFKPASVQSFIGKPICDDHPSEPVGPGNWHELAIGYVSNPRRGTNLNDDLLIADMIFTCQRGIDAVKGGKRAISVGYNAFYEQTAPGLGRQKDIHCNHVALVDEGRCGGRCTIMDGFTVYTGDLDFPGKTTSGHRIHVETGMGEFHVGEHGEVERFREGYHNAELDIEREFSRPEWLTDIDPWWDEDIDHPFGDGFEESEHPRDQAGKFAEHAAAHIARMPPEHREAVETYTRGANYLSPTQRRNLSTAIGEARTPVDATLYHGTLGARLRRMKVGETYNNRRMTSTSLSHEVAHGNMDYADPGLLELHAPKGTHGLYVQGLQQGGTRDEHEVLLGGHQYRIASKSNEGGRTHVVAHIIGGATTEDAFEETKHPRGAKGTSKGGEFVKGSGGGIGEGVQAKKEREASGREGKAEAREQAGKAQEAAVKHTEAAQRSAALAKQVGSLKQTSTRAFTGEPIPTKTQLSKLETGEIGEAVIVNYLKQFMGLKDARPLNLKTTNFPVDLIGDHMLIEAKTGLVSNSKGAQKWRATIGMPGKAERAWLAKASPVKKAAWNQKKLQAIMDRKQAVLDEYKKKYGPKVKGITMTTILNPDTKTADIYRYDGFHLHLRYNNAAAQKAYVGSFKY
jgi:hypothetical protein